MKIGRNDPCPCGSGKKYKNCCLGKIIPFPGTQVQPPPMFSQEDMAEYQDYCEWADKNNKPIPTFQEFMGNSNPATELISQLQTEMGDRTFESLEEFQEFADQFTSGMHSTGIGDFLGLSPNQMKSILHDPSFPDNVLFSLNPKMKKEDFDGVPILNFCAAFLNLLNEESGELPLTPKGNLKQVHCTKMAEVFFNVELKDQVIRSEDDLPFMGLFRYALYLAGYIDQLKTKVRLTSKGRKFLETKDKSRLYIDLISAYGDKLEWLTDLEDLYPPKFSIIQDSLPFAFYAMKQEDSPDWTKLDHIDLIQTAFPDITNVTDHYGRSIFPIAYHILFFEQFCSFFGLVQRKENSGNFQEESLILTELFHKLFLWKVD